MKLMGHKAVAMLMYYVHAEEEPVREAAELVARAGANPSRLRGTARCKRLRHHD